LEHQAGGQLMVRILEDAAERSPVCRLCSLAPRLELAHGRLDVIGPTRRQTQLDTRDHLAVAQRRASVREPELARREPRCARRGGDERPLEHLREVAAVSAGVHPDSAAGRARYRAGELETAQPRLPRTVENDGTRRSPAPRADGEHDVTGTREAREPARALLA